MERLQHCIQCTFTHATLVLCCAVLYSEQDALARPEAVVPVPRADEGEGQQEGWVTTAHILGTLQQTTQAQDMC